MSWAAGRGSRLGVLMVASEVSPWAKTGGLADVTGALPEALGRLGHEVTLVFPRYRGVTPRDARSFTRPIRLGTIVHDVTFHVERLSFQRRVVMVDIPALFERDGLYGQRNRDFDDNADRFGMLAAAALDFAEHDTEGRAIDVIHAHDWQAGLVPLIVKAFPDRYPRLGRAGFVFTIHNLAYQGLVPRDVVTRFGLPWSVFTPERAEFWGKFGFLKAGITASDQITTVSPTYARETQRAEYGAGLEGVLSARADRYVGILNGIDTDVWDPGTDPMIPARYDRSHLAGKVECKRALLERFQFSQGDDALARPIVGMVSRLVEQKGVDLITEASASLVDLPATWVFVGTGEPKFEQALRELAARHPTRVGVHIGFDEALAHLVEAGADIFLMPSKFEPCGLNQMYSLRYGTVPVVRAVGGLDDTIQPYTARAQRANGFKFKDATAEAMVRTLRQAVRLYQEKPAWRQLMAQGMSEDHSWQTSAREYVKVYRRARQAVAARTAG